MGTILLQGAGQGTVSSSSFTPLSLPGLIAWFDASSGVFNDLGVTPATDGQTVEQWNDLSGNGYHVGQTTSGNRPTFQSTGFNGKQTVSFDASGLKFLNTDQISGGTQIVAMGTGATGSVFFVGQFGSTTDGFGRLISYFGNGQIVDNTSSGSAAWIIRFSSNAELSSFRNGSFFADDAVSTDVNMRYGNIYDGANDTNYINNVGGTGVSCSLTWTSPGTISVSSASLVGGSFWSGPVSEIVITNTALSSGERTNLDNYFKAKWGL